MLVGNFGSGRVNFQPKQRGSVCASRQYYETNNHDAVGCSVKKQTIIDAMLQVRSWMHLTNIPVVDDTYSGS